MLTVGLMTLAPEFPFGSAPGALAQLVDTTTTTTPSTSSTNLAKLDPPLQAAMSNATGESPVIVRAVDGAAIAPIVALVEQLGGVAGRQLSMLNAFAATMPNASVPLLAANVSVQRIALDRPTFGANDRTNAAIGSAAVRAATGYDGRGVGIAVVDSGVTASHDDLGDSASGGSQRVRQFVDFVAGASTPYDDYGHGTHVAGIIAGNGLDSTSLRAGIAPAAHLIALKVIDSQGRGRISDVIAALDYIATNKDAFGIRVVNLSIGAAVHESFETDLLTLAAKRLVDLGIVVVAAAGNSGRTSDGRLVYGGVSAPGNAPWVVTVGASSHMGTADRTDDIVAAFSSRGPTIFDRLAKPDIVAPGVGTVSATDEHSLLYQLRPDGRVAGTVPTPQFPYLSLSGTSQAAPVVTGTVALMLQATPSLTPNAVKAILEYTAEIKGAYDSLTQGGGFLNAQGAVELARFFGAPSSSYPDAPAWSRQIIWGNHRVRGGRLTPDANAWSTSVVWGAEAHDAHSLSFGVKCPDGANCDVVGWSTWGNSCSDAQCTTTTWDAADARNAVWGITCGGLDCSTSTWLTSYDDDTVVWGNSSDDDTVVWGNTTDDDTVVWGNTTDDDTVVWGNSCATGTCGP